jgi:hypothetical protein
MLSIEPLQVIEHIPKTNLKIQSILFPIVIPQRYKRYYFFIQFLHIFYDSY